MSTAEGLSAFLAYIAEGLPKNASRDQHRDATVLSMTCRALHTDDSAAWLRGARRATEDLGRAVTCGGNLGADLRALLAAGADPNATIVLINDRPMRLSALALVAKNGTVKDMELLLAAGASVAPAPGHNGPCPLMSAVLRRSVDHVRVLLAAGANPDDTRLRRALEGPGTAVSSALMMDSPDILQALLEAGANPNARIEIGKDAHSLLDIAIGHGRTLNVRAVEALLTRGALPELSAFRTLLNFCRK